MTQFHFFILAYLLLLWLALELRNVNSRAVSLLRAMIVWIALTLLLVALLSMFQQKQVSVSVPVVLGHLEVPYVEETPITQELYPSIKCSKVPQGRAHKVVCETERQPYITQYGTTK